MPKPKSEQGWGHGQLIPTEAGFSWRARLAGLGRKTFALRAGLTERQAQARAGILATTKARLQKAGAPPDRVERILTEAAGADDVMLKLVLQVVEEDCAGEIYDVTAGSAKPTFRDVARRWTSGELHAEHEDHVREKDSTRDAQRLAKIMDTLIGASKFGDLPVDRIELKHCDAVMAALPKNLSRTTRRAYGQTMSKVLSLSVFPLGLREASPIPAKWLPRADKPPAFTYLRPSEDAKLMGCTSLPLAQRLLFGFLAREGCRVGEAAALRWRDVDLEIGSILLEDSKTGESRTWALGDDVAAALRLWQGITRASEPSDLVFTDEHGRPIREESQAEQLRAALLVAGVNRHQLHHDGPRRSKLRAHDLRAGFATLSLASGRTEDWVRSRTGWTSSAMVARYRRQANSAA
ncbi:MAG: tyrosine-type recombinase/integrase, partial [Myxococcales bacterium]|nr:tyrosine-type recombinase/integrase [Myxococcales bacterium]